MHHPVRVVLADDHPMVRRGLRLILDSSPHLDVVAEAASGRELIELIDRVQADVAVIDLDMPGVDGFEAVRVIRERHPQIRCLVLTMHDECSYMQRAALAGATGYLLKTDLDEALVKGVMTVADGKAALHPSMTQYLIRELAGGRQDPSPGAGTGIPLSTREHDVLQAMANGCSTKQIGHDLGIGVQTVKTHIAHIYAKMGLKDRTHAVAAAMRQGLVQ
jgi:DNA-binding NarL/FixJ family response regulator